MLGGLQVEKPLMDTLDSHIKNAKTPQDIEAIVNMVRHHPEYVEKTMPALTRRLDGLMTANNMSIPGSKKPALPKSEAEASGKVEDPLGVVARRGAKSVDDLVSGRDLFPMSPQQEEDLNKVPKIPYNRMPGRPWGR
jgi:hypothetical protein